MSFGAVSDSNGSIAGGESVSATPCPHTAVQKKTPKARVNRFPVTRDMVFFSRVVSFKPGSNRVFPSVYLKLESPMYFIDTD